MLLFIFVILFSMLTFLLCTVPSSLLFLGIGLILLGSIILLSILTSITVQAVNDLEPLSSESPTPNVEGLLATEIASEELGSVNSNNDFLISLVDALWDIGIAKGPGSFENGFLGGAIEDLMNAAISPETTNPVSSVIETENSLSPTLTPEASNTVTPNNEIFNEIAEKLWESSVALDPSLQNDNFILTLNELWYLQLTKNPELSFSDHARALCQLIQEELTPEASNTVTPINGAFSEITESLWETFTTINPCIQGNEDINDMFMLTLEQIWDTQLTNNPYLPISENAQILYTQLQQSWHAINLITSNPINSSNEFFTEMSNSIWETITMVDSSVRNNADANTDFILTINHLWDTQLTSNPKLSALDHADILFQLLRNVWRTVSSIGPSNFENGFFGGTIEILNSVVPVTVPSGPLSSNSDFFNTTSENIWEVLIAHAPTSQDATENNNKLMLELSRMWDTRLANNPDISALENARMLWEQLQLTWRATDSVSPSNFENGAFGGTIEILNSTLAIPVPSGPVSSNSDFFNATSENMWNILINLEPSIQSNEEANSQFTLELSRLWDTRLINNPNIPAVDNARILWEQLKRTWRPTDSIGPSSSENGLFTETLASLNSAVATSMPLNPIDTNNDIFNATTENMWETLIEHDPSMRGIADANSNFVLTLNQLWDQQLENAPNLSTLDHARSLWKQLQQTWSTMDSIGPESFENGFFNATIEGLSTAAIFPEPSGPVTSNSEFLRTTLNDLWDNWTTIDPDIIAQGVPNNEFLGTLLRGFQNEWLAIEPNTSSSATSNNEFLLQLLNELWDKCVSIDPESIAQESSKNEFLGELLRGLRNEWVASYTNTSNPANSAIATEDSLSTAVPPELADPINSTPDIEGSLDSLCDLFMQLVTLS